MLSLNANLKRVLAPRSIAVIGASADPYRIGGRPLRYLAEYGFEGEVYGVNPKYQDVQGFPCVPDIASLPDGIDLAVLMLSAGHVVEAVKACASKGMAGVVVTAAGFAEAGPEGVARQQELADVAAEHGIRVMGPNTIGFRNHNTAVYATFGTDMDSGVRPGRVAVLSQSGGLGGYLGAAQLRDLRIGTRWMIDTGNEVDVDCAECVDYLSREEGISVIGLIIEGCRDASLLLESIRSARRRGIPVVVMKIGRSAAGARSVELHTGALSGEDSVWDAALAAAGAIRARDEAHFIDLVRIFDMMKRAKGDGLGIVTLSGGVATVLLDAAERCGLSMPAIGAPPEDLQASLPLVGFHNPLDASGQMANTPDAIERLVEFMLAQDNIDVVIVWLAYALLSPRLGPIMGRGVAEAAKRSDKPVIVCAMASPVVADLLAEAGVALMPFPTNAVEVLADALTLPPAPERSFEASRADGTGGPTRLVTGPEAERLLPDVPFVPCREATSAEEAADALAALGAPVVMKGEVPGLAHKSELGLVKLGVVTADEARAAFGELEAAMVAAGKAGTVTVQPQRSGLEVIVGGKHDPVFGPVVIVGLGGVFVEVFKDVVTLLAPCSEAEVLAAIRRLAAWPLFAGARGRPPVDAGAVARTVAALSQTMVRDRTIAAVDLNPIFVTPDGAAAVDVVIEVRD